MNEENELSEKELQDAGYRKYEGDHIDVYYNTKRCEHVGNCVKGNPNVFEVGRKPWIIPNNADEKAVSEVVNTCPTGALKFKYKK